MDKSQELGTLWNITLSSHSFLLRNKTKCFFLSQPPAYIPAVL